MKTGHEIVPIDPYLEILVDTQENKERENQDSHVFLKNKRCSLELPQEQNPATFMEYNVLEF